jgi:UDP-glucose 4-epimerase
VALASAGHEIVALDNLCNSKAAAIDRVRELTGAPIEFVHADIRDGAVLRVLFRRAGFEAVAHLAALKSIDESCRDPLAYFENNVAGTVCLLRAMAEAGVKRMLFSSSAAVYGAAAASPIREEAALSPASPYGATKMFVERILQDLGAADADWRIAVLRYFNPAGAHESGRIGESPLEAPQNLVPYLLRVIAGKLPELRVFGDDYPTPDGTGVRDYIHVMDVGRAHAQALAWLASHRGVEIWNLGTGRGASVLEVIRAFESAAGRPVPFRVVGRRDGDMPCSFADPSKAAHDLGWRAERTLADMCRDALRWQAQNPEGYL